MDISKCNSEDCPCKQKCYRYKAEADIYQGYIEGEPEKGKNCEFFWELR